MPTDDIDHLPNFKANLADYLDSKGLPDCAERVRWIIEEAERGRKIEDACWSDDVRSAYQCTPELLSPLVETLYKNQRPGGCPRQDKSDG